jgi:hypothetical protein
MEVGQMVWGIWFHVEINKDAVKVRNERHDGFSFDVSAEISIGNPLNLYYP